MGTPLNPTPAIAITIETEEKSVVSRTTIAHLNGAEQKMIDIKASLISDLANSDLKDKETVLNAVVKVNSIQNQIKSVREELSLYVTEEFSNEDVQKMRDLKKSGETEVKIASLFETNQTKVNRLLNKVIPPDVIR